MTELTCSDPATAAALVAVPAARAAARAHGRVQAGSGPDRARPPCRPVLAAGGLSGHELLIDGPFVTARDASGSEWSIAAAAVWADVAVGPNDDAEAAAARPVGGSDQVNGRHRDIRHDAAWWGIPPRGLPLQDVPPPDEPQWTRPRTVGLAVGSTWAAAMLAGLSDRLGWEAIAGLAVGADAASVLPPLDGVARAALLEDPASAAVLRGREVRVLDGRRTAVPTVVVAGDGLLRWGAGSTWVSALQRALYGDDAMADHAVGGEAELQAIAERLVTRSIVPVGVDLGTATLERAGIARVSAQLTLAQDPPVPG